MLIEQAKEVNEAPEGPTAVILLFFLAFGCRITWRLTATRCASFAAQFLTLAKHQGAMVPLMMGHHIYGHFLGSYRRPYGGFSSFRPRDRIIPKSIVHWQRVLARMRG